MKETTDREKAITRHLLYLTALSDFKREIISNTEPKRPEKPTPAYLPIRRASSPIRIL